MPRRSAVICWKRGKPYVEQRQRRGVAGRHARRAEHGGDELDAVLAARADEHVARLARVAGLDAVDPAGACARACCGWRTCACGCPSSGAPRPVDGRAEEAVRAQDDGEPHEVARASSSCPARRARSGSRSACWSSPSCCARRFISRTNARSEPDDALGERDRRVVGGLDQQAAHQVAHASSARRARGRSATRPAPGSSRAAVKTSRELRPLEREQRGHQLRRRGDRAPLVRRWSRTRRRPWSLDHDRARRVDLAARRALGGAGGGRGERGGEQDERQRAGGAHCGSRIRWPGASSCGSRSGLAFSSCSSEHAGLLGDAGRRVARLDDVDLALALGSRASGSPWRSPRAAVVLAGSSPPSSRLRRGSTNSATAKATSASGARNRAGLRPAIAGKHSGGPGGSAGSRRR